MLNSKVVTVVYRTLILAVLIPLLSACSYLPDFLRVDSGNEATEDEFAIANDYERSRLIALDMVNTLVQVPSLAPASTALFADQPTNQFGRILFSALQEAGYDLRVGVAGESDRLEYSIVLDSALSAAVASANGTENAALYTFYVAAHEVKIKRQYEADAVGVRPVSSMYVHGADVAEIAVNDELFETEVALETAVAETEEPLDAEGSDAEEIVVVAAVKSSDGQDQSFKALASRKRVNMYETRQSNFSDVFADYSTLREEQLIFPNDSLVMGDRNKFVAREIAAGFDPAVDIVSVIGCSHGKSNIVDGNSKLANGRAARVKEELILAGIAPERVLEEGCWAAVHFDGVMPRRGVVLSHKRRQL